MAADNVNEKLFEQVEAEVQRTDRNFRKLEPIVVDYHKKHSVQNADRSRLDAALLQVAGALEENELDLFQEALTGMLITNSPTKTDERKKLSVEGCLLASLEIVKRLRAPTNQNRQTDTGGPKGPFANISSAVEAAAVSAGEPGIDEVPSKRGKILEIAELIREARKNSNSADTAIANTTLVQRVLNLTGDLAFMFRGALNYFDLGIPDEFIAAKGPPAIRNESGKRILTALERHSNGINQENRYDWENAERMLRVVVEFLKATRQ